MAKSRNHKRSARLCHVPKRVERSRKVGHQVQNIGRDYCVELASCIRKRIDIGLLTRHVFEPGVQNPLLQRFAVQWQT
jgi:hypothetical protein